jgi:hypothetical protein
LADKAGLFHQTESLSDSLLTLIMPAIQTSMWLVQSSNVQPLAHARYSTSDRAGVRNDSFEIGIAMLNLNRH